MIYDNQMCESIVRKYFDTRIIKKNDILIVGLSGGIDSMCLFDIFYKLQDEFQYKLYALHVHHGIRGDEADRDLDFVKDYCESLGVKLFIYKFNAIEFAKDNRLSLEEAGRKLRYSAFESEIKKNSNKKNNVYILVAHHKKDQVETIIHNVLRGSGIKGLIGMNNINNNILRPLLDFDKDDIVKYVDTFNIPYVEDSTNNDEALTRNYIRKEIVDKLNKVNNKAFDHIIDLGSQLRDIDDYITKVSDYVFNEIVESVKNDEIVICLNKIKTVHIVVKTGVIKKIFNKLVNTNKDIGKVHFNDIIKFIENDNAKHLDMPYNITVDKKKKYIIFKKNINNVSMSRRKKV